MRGNQDQHPVHGGGHEAGRHGCPAQTNDEDTTTTLREQAENWNYYQQSTRVPPAERKARMQADTTQRELADRWTYYYHYYHATRMSPAEFKAWTQAKDRAGTSTAPPAQVPAPARPGEPSGQPTWLVVSLGAWRRHWRSSLDWPAGRQAREPQGSRRARGLTTVTVRPPCRR
jgi:hypothetical protein